MSPAARSSTQFALLGLLSHGPGSGYGLKKFAESSVGHFWSESYGQIYPTLKQLETARLIRSTVEETPGKPDRIVYAITPEGRQALADWLPRDPKPESVRIELLLKLFFGEQTALDTSIAHVERARTEEIERLAHYEAIERELTREHSDEPGYAYWLYTLRYGQHRSRAAVAWADETLGSLRAAAANAHRQLESTTRGKNAAKEE